MTTTQTALDYLGRATHAYELAVEAYRGIANAAAEAEFAHKVARAKAILREKGREDQRVSHAEAETRAEADDTVAALYLDRIIKASNADSHREYLRELRERVASARVRVTSEREVDRLHAQGMTGAA